MKHLVTNTKHLIYIVSLTFYLLKQTRWLIVAKCGMVLMMCIKNIPMNMILTVNTNTAIANNINVIIIFLIVLLIILTQSFRGAKVLLFHRNT